MSSNINRPMSTASSVSAATSNQNSSNSNKKTQVKQNKPGALGEKATPDASSTSDIREIG
jgi:hypothetical protein